MGLNSTQLNFNSNSELGTTQLKLVFIDKVINSREIGVHKTAALLVRTREEIHPELVGFHVLHHIGEVRGTSWCPLSPVPAGSNKNERASTGPPIQARAPREVGLNFDLKMVSPFGKV